MKSDRFRKRRSGQSGFDYLAHEMIKEGGVWIGPDERDDPPPSRLSLGGEGDINRGSYFRDSTSLAIDSSRENPTFFITDSGITAITNHPYMRVTGSNGAVTITANPAISVGREGQVLTLFCTDSSITINDGNGVSLMASRPISMTSGSVITLIFTTGGNVWQETSRVSSDFGLGG